MIISGKIMRPPSRIMELANPNMTHHENNYCAVMMKIYALKIDCKEREAIDYLWSK